MNLTPYLFYARTVLNCQKGPFLRKFLTSLRKKGWRWIAESQVVSEKISEGGHLSFFSGFLPCLNTVDLHTEDLIRLLTKPNEIYSMFNIQACLCLFVCFFNKLHN